MFCPMTYLYIQNSPSPVVGSVREKKTVPFTETSNFEKFAPSRFIEIPITACPSSTTGLLEVAAPVETPSNEACHLPAHVETRTYLVSSPNEITVPFPGEVEFPPPTVAASVMFAMIAIVPSLPAVILKSLGTSVFSRYAAVDHDVVTACIEHPMAVAITIVSRFLMSFPFISSGSAGARTPRHCSPVMHIVPPPPICASKKNSPLSHRRPHA